MRYQLKHALTLAGVGCFSAQPGPNLSFNEMLEHLREHPLDTFMHRHLLEAMAEHRTRKFQKLVEAMPKDDPVLTALLYESSLVHDRFAHFRGALEEQGGRDLAAHTPLVHLRVLNRPGRDVHLAWNRLFGVNVSEHGELPSPGEARLDYPYAPDELRGLLDGAVHVSLVRREMEDEGLPESRERAPLAETIARAEEALERVDALAGPMMRHKACLSPHALMQSWMVGVRSRIGRNELSLEGFQTAYGRGFDEDSAKASCLMEVAERYSSYGSFGKNGVLGLSRSASLIHGSRLELLDGGENPLDLGLLRLEVEPGEEVLYWMEGWAPDGRGGREKILVPAQFVYLFCNLDEQDLTSGMGSTGLAAGNTLAEARTAGLTEALERHAEATVPFSWDRVFIPESDDPRVSRLLQEYRDFDTHVGVMDLTPEFGVPCYQAFVVGDSHGDVNKGTGAGLSGLRAVVSAMTEIPYPLPGPATRRLPEGVPARRLEDLPDYSTGSAEGDATLLERTFLANGHRPVHVELTRKDLSIPAVRTLVTGFEFMTDMDEFCTVSPTLFANYLRLHGEL